MTRATLSDPPLRGPDEIRVLAGAAVERGLLAGLTSVGITSADVFDGTRSDLVDRKRRGLSGTMQFTYRNPERSTDPSRILPGASALVVGAWSYRQDDRPADDPGPATVPAQSERPSGRVRPLRAA